MKLGTTTSLTSELLQWDSEWWGVRVARANSTAALDAWARANTKGCLWLLLDGGDHEGVRRAEESGARLVDVRVEYERETEPFFVPRVRPIATVAEQTRIIEIARTAFRGLTRFYADPRFPDERCDDLYENWIKDSLGGWARAILVIEDDDGSVGGFVTVHADGGTSSIGLIAVAEECRGYGFGWQLCHGALNAASALGAGRMTVVTQGRNIAAQRSFQLAGYRITKSDLWFHSWAE